MSISGLAGKHTGQHALLLGNGPGLVTASQHSIPEDVVQIGLSQSWRLFPNPTYHIVIDSAHLRLHGTREGLAKLGTRLLASPDIGMGTPLTLRAGPPDGPAWIQDSSTGVVVSSGGVGSVMYVALQLAAYMGFSRIWICGFEQAGLKFTGEPPNGVDRQASLFALVPASVQARVRVIEPTASTAFQTCAWPWWPE